MDRYRYFSLWPAVLSALVIAAALVAAARSAEKPPLAHMTVANPATLDGARAEEVYQAIRARMQQNYAGSGDPVVSAYQSWRRYNTAPYRSSSHGERFVNNYANRRAARYGRFEQLGAMPPGAIIAKDSFTVTADGEVMTGPFFLMEKKPPGFDPDGGDWLYMMIGSDGRLRGITGGRGSPNVAFCGRCHGKAPAGQDHLYLVPGDVRRR